VYDFPISSLVQRLGPTWQLAIVCPMTTDRLQVTLVSVYSLFPPCNISLYVVSRKKRLVLYFEKVRETWAVDFNSLIFSMQHREET